ncbi:hypothetical protein AB6B38_09550 [Glycocaulis abyssi]|uniref:Uncharacterized protein n=1 Tax=Glycocaulis abyssi TaxID=1433403 RepID=A0ABV9NES0_9PROT
MQVEQNEFPVESGMPLPAPRDGASGGRRKAFRARLLSVGDCAHQTARLFRDARSGTLKVEDASRLANILAILSRMIEGSALEARVEALEKGRTLQ